MEQRAAPAAGGVPVSVHVSPDRVSSGEISGVLVGLTSSVAAGKLDIEYETVPAEAKGNVLSVAPKTPDPMNRRWVSFEIQVDPNYQDPCIVIIRAATVGGVAVGVLVVNQ